MKNEINFRASNILEAVRNSTDRQLLVFLVATSIGAHCVKADTQEEYDRLLKNTLNSLEMYKKY